MTDEPLPDEWRPVPSRRRSPAGAAKEPRSPMHIDTPSPLLTSLMGTGGHATDRLAVRIGTDSLTRSEPVSAAAAVADRIHGASVVAVHATATVETVVAIVGCLMTGTPAVPLPPDSGPAERNHILADSGAEIVLGHPIGGLSIPTLPIDITARSGSSYHEPDPRSTAVIMYTSGTTGAPKGVILSRRAIAASLDGLADAWQWSADDTLVHGLPLFHVHGLVLGVIGALRHGSPLLHTIRPKPELYARENGTLYFGVPTIWSRIAADEASARALAPARLLISGSAPLPLHVFDRLNYLTGQGPIERYGMSETVITVSARAHGERRAGWVGIPIRGVQTRLRDDSGEALPHDGETTGHLQITGPTLFDGYLGNPDKTAAEFTDDGWFKTGDIAVIDPGGFHRIVGRESVDMIKSGGYRIGAGEVEHALLSHSAVAEAAVVGLPDSDLGQRVVAYVVGQNIDPKELSNFVASTLSTHKRPREIRTVAALPRNTMGKVTKKKLIEDS
jgi:fatty acid CoA ligase FadD36